MTPTSHCLGPSGRPRYAVLVYAGLAFACRAHTQHAAYHASPAAALAAGAALSPEDQGASAALPPLENLYPAPTGAEAAAPGQVAQPTEQPAAPRALAAPPPEPISPPPEPISPPPEPISPPAMPFAAPATGPAAPSAPAPTLVTRLAGPAKLVTEEETTVRFVGHRSCLVDFAGLHVLFASNDLSKLVAPKRGKRPRRIKLPRGRIDAVAIGSLDSAAMAPEVARALWRQYRPTFVTPRGGRARLVRLGIKRDHIVEQDAFATRPLGTGAFSTTLVPSHLPESHLSYPKEPAAAGFVLSSKGRALYFAGESAFGKQFAAVHDQFGPLDVAILNVVAGADSTTAKQHHHTLTLVEAAHAQAILASKVTITLPAKVSISHASALALMTGSAGCFITPKNGEVVHVGLGADGACESQHAAANQSVQSVRLGSSLPTPPGEQGAEGASTGPETSVEQLPLFVP